MLSSTLDYNFDVIDNHLLGLVGHVRVSTLRHNFIRDVIESFLSFDRLLCKLLKGLLCLSLKHVNVNTVKIFFSLFARYKKKIYLYLKLFYLTWTPMGGRYSKIEGGHTFNSYFF